MNSAVGLVSEEQLCESCRREAGTILQRLGDQTFLVCMRCSS